MTSSKSSKFGSSTVTMKKEMGLFTLIAIGVGSVIGDGIFLSIGQSIQLAGPGAILSFVVAGFLQISLMIGLSELAVALPSPGAMSLWVEKFMGKWWGFLAGITFAVGFVVAGATCGIAMGKFTCYWFPDLNPQIWVIAFALFFNAIFAVVNILGAQIAGRLQLILVVIMVAIMTAFAIFGAKDINSSHFNPFFTHGVEGFLAAIPLGVYAYQGAITLATAGAEVKNPRDLGRALVWCGVIFTVLYCGCQIVATGIVPANEVSLEVSLFTLAAEKVFGPAGATIINIAAWIAAATCVIMGAFYAVPRIFYQLAESKGLPKQFGYLHPKYRTPVFGIIVSWIIVTICVFFAYFATNEVYILLCEQNVLAWMISWGLALICAFKFRKNHMNLIEKSKWKQPLYPLFPVLGVLGCIYTVYLSFSNNIVHVYVTLGVVAFTGLLYFFFARKNYQGVLATGEEAEIFNAALRSAEDENDITHR